MNPVSPGTGSYPGFRLTPQLLFGLLVIGAGVLFMLDNLGILRADDYFRLWPAGLVAIGALKLWQGRQGSGSIAGALFLGAGLWLLLDEFEILRVGFGELWPALLILFGSYLVWQGLSERAPRGAPQETPGARLSAMAILGGVSRGTSSQAFRGADLTAIMGGCELDLRQAAIHGDAVVDVFALWGGIEIKVPEGWHLESQVIPLLGGVEEKTRSVSGSPEHRLVLRGFAIMGAIEVKN